MTRKSMKYVKEILQCQNVNFFLLFLLYYANDEDRSSGVLHTCRVENIHPSFVKSQCKTRCNIWNKFIPNKTCKKKARPVLFRFLLSASCF